MCFCQATIILPHRVASSENVTELERRFQRKFDDSLSIDNRPKELASQEVQRTTTST
jgi:hypothetical protein